MSWQSGMESWQEKRAVGDRRAAQGVFKVVVFDKTEQVFYTGCVSGCGHRVSRWRRLR